MTLETTISRLVTVHQSVSGVGNVFDLIRTSIERDEAESRYFANGRVNCWEISGAPSRQWEGASAEARTTLDVRVTAHFRHDDENDSRGEFVSLLASVFEALMTPTTGFPQVAPDGINMLERPDRPIGLRTGQSAYRAVYAFNLLDVEST